MWCSLVLSFSPQAERELEEDLVLGNSSHHWWHQVNKQPQVNVTRSQTRVVVLHSISPHGEIYTNGFQTDITLLLTRNSEDYGCTLFRGIL